ncbi:MAG: SdpI family protein [Clostridia bacterium]|nr:SdpI family protein [Clostridia bacterium]
MGFWFFMLAMVLLIPGLMIFFGRRFMDKPPEDIGFLYGYRTYRSMRNQDTWCFAHQHFGRLWYRWGLWLLLSAIPMLFFIQKGEDAIGIAGTVLLLIQLIPMMIPIVLTERALKKHFDKDGNPVNPQ